MARQIIDTPGDRKLWVLGDRDPVMTWTDGRVALLGDAAHPMLQFFAQGACLAMEDAVCLSAMIDEGTEFPATLLAYQDKRRLRTARVKLQSR